MRKTIRFAGPAAALVSILCGLCPAAPASAGDSAPRLAYTAVDPSVFVDDGVVRGWVARFDEARVREHAWRLWAAITAPSGQAISVVDARGRRTSAPAAVFETWFDEFEVFHTEPAAAAGCAGPCDRAHRLHRPRQAPDGGAGDVVSYNKYSAEFAEFVDRNHYWGEQTLIDRNAAFDREKTPLAQRFLAGAPPHAIMLKPVYWIVKADRPTLMPVWKGPGLAVDGTTNATTPVPSTWTAFVVVDPTGRAKPGDPQTLDVATPQGPKRMTAANAPIVGLDRFYWFPLSDQDVRFLAAGNVFTVGGVALGDLEAGDLALLVGMHVTTDELVDDWTWQTFWWRPEPVAEARRFVEPPFDSYELATAYWMVGPDGAPRVAYNPYLEAIDAGSIFLDPAMLGVKSNCMSCHHAAAFPTLNRDPNQATMLDGSYFALGRVTGTEPWFAGRTKTSFMWGMIMQNQCVGVGAAPSSVFCKLR
ncbi:hypothetical protein DFR50_13066 [Roseiarcus fermentans]|uniref:Cytochrome c domain-containing protein n=1 Tax=Roseiarcus fermentans TaxID=1473586 RepID=A0A366EYC8_9HYPH|nr:hypothetical protein [Roseiarcus fermentans]RBP06509.1 hypothetical protein DFR50_13066 [Roseiarcus fermentans]